jgi:hypothetical protein
VCVFGGRRAVGKPVRRSGGAVWKNAVYLFQIWNCNAAVTMTEGWGKEIGETTTDNKKRHRGRRRRKGSVPSNDEDIWWMIKWEMTRK